VNESAGPFPWSDLGITASASVSGGGLLVATGGSTSYSFLSSLTGGEAFTPGVTSVNLGYTPGWTGSIATIGVANGDFNSSLVWNIGPFSGSHSLVNAPLVSSPLASDISGNLNTLSGLPFITGGSGSGLSGGLTGTLSAQAGICPFCVTVASVSLSVTVSSEIQQAIAANPNINYGDLVWYSTSPTYSPSDTFTVVNGAGGNIQDTFMKPPASLGLTNGEDFYMNILPLVSLDMPVSNDVAVSLPASLGLSWDVFGDSGSSNYPLGDLYSLDNGAPTFDFDPTFYGSNFYSIPMSFSEDCNDPAVACQSSYNVLGSGGVTPSTPNGGIPGNLLPPTTDTPGQTPTPGGYGFPNIGPLFPGDPSSNPPCDPTGANCITQVNFNSTPEPSGGTLGLVGVALIAAARMRLGKRSRAKR
jgi:hypothetical protein